MATVPQVATVLQSVLTTTAETAARTSGFIKRARKLTGPTFVQGLVFGWLAHPEATMDQLVQAIARADVFLSAPGLQQRFTTSAVTCLEMVLAAAATTVISAEEVGASLLKRFTAVWLLDSSTVGLPADYATDWPASGGGGKAAAKLHTMIDLRGGALLGPILGAGRPQDRQSPLQTVAIAPGAIRITDLGFYALQRLRAIGDAGAYWLCRAQVQTRLFTADGAKWSLVSFMAAQRGDMVDVTVELGVKDRLPARLVAFRLDGQAAAARQRQVRHAAKKKGQQVSADRLALCAWDISVTNVPPALLSAEESRVLLRARWQTPLLFKRWKSEGKIDTSRSQQPERIRCEFYAKLIGQVITQWCAVVGSWQALDRSLVKVGRLIQDYATALTYALPSRRQLEKLLRAIAKNCQAGCRVNTRKTNPNHCELMQTVPHAA